MKLKKYGTRYWAVYDDNGQLICVTVYKKGANEVMRRLNEVYQSFSNASVTAQG